jgi:YcaO-like protein with predicted kinase domain
VTHIASTVTGAGPASAISPSETLARVRRLFGPLGVTRVANVTGLDCIGIPVVSVCRPNGRSLSVSQGKGADIDSACVSGVMEAIELYHAERVELPLRLASYDEMRVSAPVADVLALASLTVSQFRPSLLMLWVEGIDLMSGKATWIPYETVSINMTLPFPPGSGCFVMSSNGLASGNNINEALLHALCEVVERDASALALLFSKAEQQQRRLDLTTVDDEVCKDLLGRYERAGIAVAVWDVSSDVAVPVYRCEIVDQHENPFRPLPPVDGFGCHPSPAVALRRALTEAAQARLTLILGSRDDNFPELYLRSQHLALREQSRARMGEAARRALQEAPRLPTAQTIEQSVRHVVGALRDAKLGQVLVVDLSKRTLDVPVVRVVVPGLEPYHGVQGVRPGERAKRALRSAREDA